MFNNYFSSVYTSDKCVDDDTVCQEVEPVMTDLTLTVEEVQAVLENLDSTKVNHERLTHKLRMAGFGGKLLKWFHSYLTNRNQRVTVLGATSNTLPVTSGVPQGSILGPLLFVLYVNDLPDAVTSSQVAMFADDTKLFTTVKREDDCKRLQSDLDNLQTCMVISVWPPFQREKV